MYFCKAHTVELLSHRICDAPMGNINGYNHIKKLLDSFTETFRRQLTFKNELLQLKILFLATKDPAVKIKNTLCHNTTKTQRSQIKK